MFFYCIRIVSFLSNSNSSLTSHDFLDLCTYNLTIIWNRILPPYCTYSNTRDQEVLLCYVTSMYSTKKLRTNLRWSQFNCKDTNDKQTLQHKYIERQDMFGGKVYPQHGQQNITPNIFTQNFGLGPWSPSNTPRTICVSLGVHLPVVYFPSDQLRILHPRAFLVV